MSKSLTSLRPSPIVPLPLSGSKSLPSLFSSNYALRTKKLYNVPSTSSCQSPSFNRSLQSSIIQETPQNVIELYGSPLPVLVTEAVTLAERISDVSVKLQAFGWASLVCGRRLFIWKFKQESETKSTAPHCKELTLPASDLAHKAELVHVLCSMETQMPGVIAVSPEGIVRYWPNITHEGISFEAAADLQGQECYSLTSVQPIGCILATTTGSLVLIKPSTVDRQPTILCMTLKLPQGVLAGFGHRVSSFIFGAMPTQSSEAKQLNKILPAPEEDGKYSLYVLSGTAFQKWHLNEEDPYKLIFEVDLDRYLREGFLDALWNSDSSQLDQVKTWCLDMQLCRNGVILLIAGMNSLISRQLFYALGVFEEPKAPASKVFSSFTVIKYSETFTEQDEEKLLSYRFLFPSSGDDKTYVYDAQKIICVPAFCEADPDVIDFSNTGNVILGAGVYETLPLIFTQFHGLLCLRPQGSEQELQQESGSSLEQVTETAISESEHTEVCGDLQEKIRMALYLHCDGDVVACKVMVDKMYQILSDTGNVTVLDKAVVTLSLILLDDYPLSDPRWCESVPAGDFVSSSLIIMHQLDDKLKAHNHLVNFLKAYDLWNKLTVVKVKEAFMATCLVLLEHAEKLIAAKVLRRHSLEYPDVVDTVIKDVLHRRGGEVKKSLSHQDLFFREVSCVESFFVSLLSWQQEELNNGNTSSENIARVVGTVNSILAGVFQEVTDFRELNKEKYCFDQNISRLEYVPWSSNEEGPNGIRSLLLRQHATNIKYALKLPESVLSDGVILQTFTDLVDIILNGYQSQLKSLKERATYASEKEKFSKEKTKLISPLLEVKQYERTAVLAEKYHDFHMLIQLCEDINNLDALQRYCCRYRNEGFPELLFKWYLEKGERGKLFQQPLLDNFKIFLQDHKELSWLYHIRTKDYILAQQTLKEVALQEKKFVSKKKTLLSLSKLSALASDLPAQMTDVPLEALNHEQDLILQQENLPARVCECYGVDPGSARVLTPEEMIEMYTCEENTEANQYDFKIALDLLNFIPVPHDDEYIESLRRNIWCQAIRRNDWTRFNVDDPLGAIKDTLFFQIVELAFNQGVELHNFLPPVEDLIRYCDLQVKEVDLSTLSFFLTVAYEYFEKLSV